MAPRQLITILGDGSALLTWSRTSDGPRKSDSSSAASSCCLTSPDSVLRVMTCGRPRSDVNQTTAATATARIDAQANAAGTIRCRGTVKPVCFSDREADGDCGSVAGDGTACGAASV